MATDRLILSTDEATALQQVAGSRGFRGYRVRVVGQPGQQGFFGYRVGEMTIGDTTFQLHDPIDRVPEGQMVVDVSRRGWFRPKTGSLRQAAQNTR